MPGEGEPSFEEARQISKENLRKFLVQSQKIRDGMDAVKACVTYPRSFDWRNVNGRNFVTPIRDQRQCGSCVAFGTCATIEGTVHTFTDIAVNDPGGGALPDLSEAELFFCNGCVCAVGWDNYSAMSAVKAQGVPPESCMPYRGYDQDCSERCRDWQNKVTQISGFHGIYDTNAMKEWLSTKGPLLTRFDVYLDFSFYFGGVYRYTWGNLRGGHAVCCIGYNDDLQAWLCKNSWGTLWGESGYFWIGYGQCGIDAYMYAVDSLSKIYPIYNDLYIRDNLSDIGQIPGVGGASASPDIIPWGSTPAPNFQTLFKQNWGQDLGKNLAANQINYLYVRGKNLSNNAANGQINLYWSKASLLLWPSRWKPNRLSTSSHTSSANISTSRLSEVGVGDVPFQWKPDPLTADHYCLIGQVVTVQHPNLIPEDGSITDFAAWVLNNPNIAWRNISVIDTGDTPSFQAPINLTTTNPVNLYVGLRTKGVPQGCEISFTCGTVGPQPGLNLAKIAVSGEPNFMVGVRSNIPANFNSDLVVSFWKNGKVLDPDAEMVLECFYFLSDEENSDEASLRPHAMESTLLREAQQTAGFTNEISNLTPSKAILLGSYRFILI